MARARFRGHLSAVAHSAARKRFLAMFTRVQRPYNDDDTDNK